MKSLYIHFPYCLHLCNYCDFYKHKLTDSAQIERFLSLVEEQLDEFLKLNSSAQVKVEPLETLYIGGGTPSLWKPVKLKRFLSLLNQKGIERGGDIEFTMEIDPGTFTFEDLLGWKKLGVNRLSVGGQAFSDHGLKILDRRHSLTEVQKSLKLIADNFENFSVDLIIGTPAAKQRDLDSEIDQLMSYGPKHLSVYILGTRKNYPLLESMPDDELIASQYLAVSEKLKDLGFDHYEVSNFARPGYQSAHNLKYWNFRSVGALGPNATGTNVFEDHLQRYQWKSLSAGYIEERIEGSSLLLERIFLNLRMSRTQDLSSLFPLENRENLHQIIENWREKGYVTGHSKSEALCVTPRGFLFNDSMIEDLMPLIGD